MTLKLLGSIVRPDSPIQLHKSNANGIWLEQDQNC